MRIGVVTSSFPRFDGDPAGPFVAEHAAWLRSQGHHVEVVAAGSTDHASPDGGAVTRIPAAGGLFYAGGAPEALERSRGTWLQAVRFSTAMTRQVMRQARAWDAVIAHWLVPSALAACATGKPMVAIAHSGDVHLLAKTRLATPMAALLVARRARVVFVSQAVRHRFCDALPGPLRKRIDSRAQVAAMGVHVTRFEQAAKATGTRPGAPVVLFLGRLVPVKGVEVLIAAARLIGADAEVVVAGDGPHAAILARMADGMPNVRFVGEVRGAERDRLLASADLAVLPSVEVAGDRTEGMPVVALEAMAAGTAVIASRVGGLAELPATAVRHVAPREPEALARAIDELIADPAVRSAQIAAARRHAAHHDWSVVGPKLLP